MPTSATRGSILVHVTVAAGEPEAPTAVVKVARDLTAIVDLAPYLDDQAEHRADGRDLPGGPAMVALGPVASPEAWEHRYEAAEAWNADPAHDRQPRRPVEHVADEDESYEPPLQTLLYWSEGWRVFHNRESDRRPTVDSEAGFIRDCLDWAWDNELHFGDFAADVAGARARMENTLYAGERAQRGVQCFDCTVRLDRAVPLVRKARDRQVIRYCPGVDGVCTYPHRFCPHDRGGLTDEWECPSCHRQYDEETYRRAVAQSHYLYADYLPLGLCVERCGVREGTIKVWANRGKVRKSRDHERGRMTYNVADVVAAAVRGLDGFVA